MTLRRNDPGQSQASRAVGPKTAFAADQSLGRQGLEIERTLGRPDHAGDPLIERQTDVEAQLAVLGDRPREVTDHATRAAQADGDGAHVHAGHLIILPGSVEHAEALARDLRPADRLECEAYDGRPAAEVVRESYRRSLWSWTAVEPGGEPVCAWGVVPLSILGGSALVWCLTTHRLDAHRRLFARASREWVRLMLRDFERIEGFVDMRHAASVRWLGWLGLHLGEPVVDGNGVPWRRYWLTRSG